MKRTCQPANGTISTITFLGFSMQLMWCAELILSDCIWPEFELSPSVRVRVCACVRVRVCAVFPFVLFLAYGPLVFIPATETYLVDVVRYVYGDYGLCAASALG